MAAFVAQTLGTLERTICATSAYLKRHGKPERPSDLAQHRFVDMPMPDGRPRTLVLSRQDGTETVLALTTAIVDEVLTMHRPVRGGVGIGILSTYLLKADLADGTLERVLPDWEVPGVPISLVYPSRRELAPLPSARSRTSCVIWAPTRLGGNSLMRLLRHMPMSFIQVGS